MHQSPLPITRDLVLIGGGHTHALVLRKWGMDPLPGARVTLINPGPTAPYSGMLPGHIAGHYSREALDIDLFQLARFAGARIVNGAAQGIDLQARSVHVPGRPPLGFDALSVDIGITSAMPDLPGFAAHGVPAKPLGPFATAWADYRDGTGPASVAVLGGGVAGAEIAMAMAFALRERGRPAQVHLVDRSRVLPGLAPASTRRLRAAMQALGVEVHEHTAVAGVTTEGLTLEDGSTIDAAFVTGAAGARPYGWLQDTGLDLHDGFITVDSRLRSSDRGIFAVGDCAHLAFDPRPKAGVYAVREAPVLYDNLRATLAGTGLRPYRPQKDYLKLISLGGKSALAERFGLPLSGGLMWRWKDRIDQAFMDRFRDLPTMPQPNLPWPRTKGVRAEQGPKPMCGGCGAKIGRGVLTEVLAALPGPMREDVRPLPGDDAALLLTGGARQVLTTDHLRAMIADPVLMTRIAAQHALGDIWAMGARPQAATANLVLPRLSDPLTRRTLAEIMRTAHEVMRDAGAEIVGGHSSVGDELTIGFSLTGICENAPITLSGAQPGDALILTKPLGGGVIMAADMAGRAPGACVAQALEQMVQSQRGAAEILSGAHAMTDITGFGLAGHLEGMCAASGCGARVSLRHLPLLPGALVLSKQSVRSSLFDRNRAVGVIAPDTPLADLVFDPQTSGGLLAAVPATAAEALLDQLLSAGYDAARIGEVTDEAGQITFD
ncbi:selenide, water dikinase SelD [Thalassococcus sp. BH17M4-6]|uniref:selenide, water dikinase SelD n=1 Tax=Thalassococcus sp. BH17M4-6 TaxID=3413148 RepID=UPI003BC1F347